MAKMLRNTPMSGWSTCSCRQCRHNDRNGDDSRYRRARRTRDREELRVLVEEELIRRDEEYTEWLVWWFLRGVDGVPGYNGGRQPGFWDE